MGGERHRSGGNLKGDLFARKLLHLHRAHVFRAEPKRGIGRQRKRPVGCLFCETAHVGAVRTLTLSDAFTQIATLALGVAEPCGQCAQVRLEPPHLGVGAAQAEQRALQAAAKCSAM